MVKISQVFVMTIPRVNNKLIPKKTYNAFFLPHLSVNAPHNNEPIADEIVKIATIKPTCATSNFKYIFRMQMLTKQKPVLYFFS